MEGDLTALGGGVSDVGDLAPAGPLLNAEPLCSPCPPDECRMFCADVPPEKSAPDIPPAPDGSCLTKMVTAAPSALLAQTSQSSSSSICRPSPAPMRVRKKEQRKNSSSPMWSLERIRSLIAATELRPVRVTTERDS